MYLQEFSRQYFLPEIVVGVTVLFWYPGYPDPPPDRGVEQHQVYQDTHEAAGGPVQGHGRRLVVGDGDHQHGDRVEEHGNLGHLTNYDL